MKLIITGIIVWLYLGKTIVILTSIIDSQAIDPWELAFATIHWASFLLWARRISIVAMIAYLAERSSRSIQPFRFFPFAAASDAGYALKYAHSFRLQADAPVFSWILSRIHFIDDSILPFLLFYYVFLQ